jgi:hypothetical protein
VERFKKYGKNMAKSKRSDLTDKQGKGRPTKFTQEIAEEICEKIATTTLGLNAICAGERFPNVRTVYRWLMDDEDFCQMYTRAKEIQIDLLVEEIINISDDSENDTLISTSPGGELIEKPNAEWINRSRLRVDTRKWIAARLNRRKYGDNIDHTTGGEQIANLPAPNIIIHADGPPLSSSESEVNKER